MTTRDVEWDAGQQALILALALHRAEECDRCGGYLPETTNPANEGRYEATGPFMCHSCEALGRAHAAKAEARQNNPIYNMNRWSSRLRKE